VNLRSRGRNLAIDAGRSGGPLAREGPFGDRDIGIPEICGGGDSKGLSRVKKEHLHRKLLGINSGDSLAA